jgi:hypothetical protein
MVIAIPVQVRVQLPIAENAVTVHAIPVQVRIAQIAQLVRTVTAQIAVDQAKVDRQIDAMVVAQLPIVQPVAPMVIAIPVAQRVDRQIDAMIADQLIAPIVRPVHTAIEIHVHHPIAVRRVIVRNVVHHRIVPLAHTVIAIRVQVLIVQIVRLAHTVTAQTVVDQAKVDRRIDAMIAAQVPIARVVIIHLLAIVHALAMIATHAHLRVIANVVVVRIAPVVVTPMIATIVHAAA